MTRRTIHNETYRGTVSEDILKNTIFYDCDFSGAYFGKPRGEKGKIDFSKLNTRFKNCRFDGSNFKGSVGLTFSIFEDCVDLQYATHIPGQLKSLSGASPGATSPEKLAYYDTPGVFNRSVRASDQRRITDYFRAKKI